MILHLCRVALRPRGPLEVFDLSVTLARVHWRSMVQMAVLWGLPVASIASALVAIGWSQGVLWTLPLTFALVQAPMVLLGGRLLFADEVRLRDVLSELIRGNPLGFFAAWFWLTAALAGGLLCGAIGALVTVPSAIYAAEAALLEKVGFWRSLRRSSRLANANLGNALVASLGWVLLTVWGGLTVEAAGQAILGFVLQLGSPFGALIQGDVTPFMVFGMVFAQPIFAIYKLLLYVDTRTRVEGWDLQVGLRAAGLGAP